MLLYNTLGNTKQPFVPEDPRRVTMYSCGPTVYRDVHLGNLRSFLLADWLKRALRFLGYGVFHVKNITDVGHMRQELLERGEDKIVAAARKAGLSSRQIADRYTRSFLEDEARLNIIPADVLPRATEHIPHCIALIERLLDRGHAYLAGGNVYFDVESFPDYGKLSGNLLPGLIEAVRVEPDPHKRKPQDFTLWKAAEPGREMKWPSPWGEGFPGWHIECSAMSLHYLGERIDLHTGAVDNIFPHHEDELAQSEAAVGHPVVRHWVHGQHLLADGVKMAKSASNDYTIRDIENRGFDPLSFRYLCLTVHYRSRLNFTFGSLKAAQRGLSHLRRHVEEADWKEVQLPDTGPAERWIRRFQEAIMNDLALPRGLSILWEMLHDRSLSRGMRARILVHCDEVLGLGLGGWHRVCRQIPEAALEKARAREALRGASRFLEADGIREEMRAQGLEVRDRGAQTMVLRRSRAEWAGAPREISSSWEVPNLLEEPEAYEFTVSLTAWNNSAQISTLYRGIREHCRHHSVQIIVVEGGSTDRTREILQELLSGDPDSVIWLADHRLGEAASRNVALRQALGKVVVLMDACVEPTGDFLAPMAQTLAQPEVGLTGAVGLVTENCQEFREALGVTVQAITLYCMAFPRSLIRAAGWMDERFRFYRHLDLDYSFRIRSLGYKAVVTRGLPLRFHPQALWESMEPEERDRRSRANFYLFYRKWHHREELFAHAPHDPGGGAWGGPKYTG